MKTAEHMKRGTRMLVAAAGFLSCGATAMADETWQAPSAEPTTIHDGELDDLRGGDAATTIAIRNSQDLTASVEDVTISADSILTGAINIGERAFDNFSGVGMFNMVTGNSNAVNSAIEVTFTLE